MVALIRAILKTAYREVRTLNSIQGNNFFFFALLLSLQPESMAFIWTLLGLVMMVPALAAPLARIPEIRLKLWPLSVAKGRLMAPFTKPETQASLWLWRVLPVLELRQIARTLDFWLAFLLALAGTLYRVLSAQPNEDAYPVLAMMVVLCLSTLAQNLFALDGQGGRLRWRLSPVRGYRVLWRKGGLLISIAGVLTAGLNPVGGVAGMLAALAIGHHFSVFSPIDAGAWRFSMGQFFPYGLMQVIGMFSCGIAAGRGEMVYFWIAAAGWLFSSLIYGWMLEHAPLQNV